MDIWRFFSGHTACNPEIGPQNQKSALPQLFGLTTAFPNGMTQPGSTNDHLPAPLQGKGQGAGQGLLGGGTGQEGVLPTQKLLQTNLAMPSKFHSNPFTCLKVIHDFQCHRRIDRHSNSIQKNHPSTVYGCVQKFFLPCFFYLSQNGISLLHLLKF